MKIDESGIKFGPFWLMPGIKRVNATTYFFSAFMFVTLVTFLNFLQPYILDEILHVPADKQGVVTGNLNFFHESIALMVMGFVGSLSDRTGRRRLIVIGLLIWAAGFVIFPLANSVFQLYLARFIIAIGVATASVMVIATMQDYPQEASRGKWGGVNSFITSFAILFLSLVLVRLPNIFSEAGFDSVQSGRLTFWVGAAMALLAALVCRVGFYGGKISGSAVARSPFAGLVDGVNAARVNPRLALAYGSAFAARGDLVVIGAFFSLWFVRAGAEQGISSGDAIVRSGITMSALLVATWIWAPLFGYLIDRIDRVTGLLVAMSLAVVGYFVIGLVSDPYNMAIMIPATFILGIGEISAIVAGNALLGEQAPPTIRGAAVGVFGLIGTMGILFATLLGGQVFDKIAYSAPFMMMAGVNALVVVWAALVRYGAAGSGDGPAGSTP